MVLRFRIRLGVPAVLPDCQGLEEGGATPLPWRGATDTLDLSGALEMRSSTTSLRTGEKKRREEKRKEKRSE